MNAQSSQADRVMPAAVDLGTMHSFTLGEILLSYANWKQTPECDRSAETRYVMGFALPAWQRGSVWTRQQQISLIESLWKGVPIGTYTVNQLDTESPLDNILIDGQQRLTAIEAYLSDEFAVYGYRYSEITPQDKRRFRTTIVFPAYITKSSDESYLRSYYNLLNFGGSAHTEAERA